MQLSEDLSCQFSQSTDTSFLLSTLNSFRGCWGQLLQQHDLILVEVDGKQARRASANL